MAEIWRVYPGDLRYEISSYGGVRRISDGRRLFGCPHGRGCYLRVSLRGRPVFIHVAVLETFVGPRPEGHRTNHKDGRKRYNRLSNLEWKTPAANNQHAYDTGLRRRKLREGELWLLRRIAGSELFSKRKIAKMFKVNKQTVSNVVAASACRRLL